MMTQPNWFIAHGSERHRDALELELRAAIVAEFAERMAAASFLGRLWWRVVIWRELDRRLELAVSPQALY